MIPSGGSFGFNVVFVFSTVDFFYHCWFSKVLEEIAQQNFEEEIIRPILEIQLVLRVPSLSAHSRRTPRLVTPHQPPEVRSHATEQSEATTESDKKVVKFPEEPVLSGMHIISLVNFFAYI